MFKQIVLASLVASSAAFSPLNRVAPVVKPHTRSSTTVLANPEWAQAEFDGRQSEWAALDVSKTIYTSSMKAPKDAYITFAEKGVANAKMSKHKIFHQSVLGGAYVGFGGMLALSIAGNLAGISTLNPAVSKFTFAALFPVNLLLVICTKGQLFTGNTATVAAAKYERLVEWREYFRSLTCSLIGNIVGCGLFAWAAMYCGLLNGGAGNMAIGMATGKCAAPFGVNLVKGILCNWMVSLAVFLASASNDLSGKIVGCWFPISTFVGIGLEHSVANLFLFPAAIMAGASLTVGDVIVKNLIPVVLGNLIAGSIVVAASYSYQFGNLGAYRRDLFLKRQEEYEKRIAIRKKEREQYELENPSKLRRAMKKVVELF